MYLQRWIQHDLPNIVILQAHVFFGGQKIHGNHQRQVSPTSDINPPSPPDWKEGYAEFKNTKVPGERSKNGRFIDLGLAKDTAHTMCEDTEICGTRCFTAHGNQNQPLCFHQLRASEMYTCAFVGTLGQMEGQQKFGAIEICRG